MKKQHPARDADYNKMVPAVAQAAKILVELSAMPETRANLTDIARGVGISKSKASAILNTLLAFGFVMRNPDTKVYALGPSMMTIGQKATECLDYGELAAPLLRELANATGSTAILGLITGEDQYTILRQESTWQTSMLAPPNKVHPLTYGAHGKAIVAFVEEERQRKIFSEQTPYFYKDPERFDRARLEREMAECRACGFARDHETGHPMVNILSAPIHGIGGRPIGAMEIIGLMEEAEIPEKGKAVVEMAKRFSRLTTESEKEATIGKENKKAVA